MSDDAAKDEVVQHGEEKKSGMNSTGAGLGWMIGVFGTWIIFDRLALGLLVGMVGLIIGGSVGQGANAGAGDAGPESPDEGGAGPRDEVERPD